jgi:hypothetical protein
MLPKLWYISTNIQDLSSRDKGLLYVRAVTISVSWETPCGLLRHYLRMRRNAERRQQGIEIVTLSKSAM